MCIRDRAYTVLFAPHDDPREEINYIDNVPGGSVPVLAPTIPLQTETAPYTRVNQAMYGGLMSTRAQYSGARGTVVFGRIRDLEEQKALNYPVFSYGLGSCAAKMALKPVAVNVPLSILSIDSQVYSIHPGDYIVGDCHGIVRIPVMDVEIKDLVAYVKKSVEIDDLIALDAKQGKPVKASQKERRAVLKKLVE